MTDNLESPAIISAGKTAGQAAAEQTIAASALSQRTKPYETLSVPAFPKGGGMTKWMYALGTATVVVGCLGDELAMQWLRECWSKSVGDIEKLWHGWSQGPAKMDKALFLIIACPSGNDQDQW